MDVTRPDSAAGTAQREGSSKDYDAFISYAREGDGVFAAVLQRGLHHLAKPWNRRRAMEVFRDRTSLPVSAGLLPSIRNALDASRWFVLLASPESARSNWVGEEITYWVSSKGAGHVLIVLTDGTWTWDKTSNDLSPASTARNPALCGVFAAEPNILNMTWARRNADLTLRNAHFRDDVATLAAAIREVPKEEIEGEDVRQQRRTRRIVRAVIAALTVLVLLTSALAVSFNLERLQAIRQRQDAIHERDVAVSDQLISQSELLGDTNPAIAKLLSVAAWDIHSSSDARYAMLAASANPGIAVLTGLNGPVDSVAFSPDGKTLATGCQGGVQLWDVATRQPVGHPLTGTTQAINSVAYSPDGHTLATVSDYYSRGGSTVRVWDVATRREIGSPLTSTSSNFLSVAFSPDGKTLATGDGVGKVRLWDAVTGRETGKPFTGPSSGADALAFSPDGTTLASISNYFDERGGTVRLWDVASHRQLGHPLTITAGAVQSVAFSPDGKTLVTGSIDGAVQLWDVASYRQAGRPLAGITGGFAVVAFSPDGKTLATGTDNGTVQLWDVATRQQVGSILTGATGAISSIAVSPDGKTLAGGTDSGTVQLWDMATGRRQIGSPLTGHAHAGFPRWRSARTAKSWPTSVSPTARPRSTSVSRTANPWYASVPPAASGCGMWPPSNR